MQQPIDPDVALNLLRDVVRDLSHSADRQRETVERPEGLYGERAHPLGTVALLQQVWRGERDPIRSRFSLPDDVVRTIEAFVDTLTGMESAWRAGSPMDDFDGAEWSRVRALAQAILLRTPNPRDARLRDGDVIPTIPPSEDGLRRLFDVLEGSARLEVEPGRNAREDESALSTAVALLGTAFPDTFVEEFRRRDLVDDRTLTWGIHLMGDLPSALAPILLEGFLESSSRTRAAWLGLLVDYPQHAARDDLVRTLIDPSESVRAQAAIALRRIGDPTVADALEGSISARPPQDPQLLGTMQRALAALRRT